MEGSIISSVFFVVSVSLLYVGIFRIKKSENPLNGVIWVMMNFISLLCWGAFCGGIINMLHIPVNIVSMGAIYLVSAAAVFFKIKKDGETQNYEWKKYDIIYTCIFAGVIFLLLLNRITIHMDFVFNNSDAAVHMRNSLTIVRTGKLDTMYFAPMHNALITEIFLPFIEKVSTYKVFMMVDGAMFILEAVFFMTMIRDYLNKTVLKILGITIGFAYVFGYPMHSYLLCFFYWGIGVLLIEYIITLVKEFAAGNIRKETGLFLMMTGCTSITMCYMLFGPVSYVAVFVCLCVWFCKKNTLFSWDTVKISLQIFLIPCIMSVYYCYFLFLKKQNLSIGDALNLQGGIYGELFINFIWVMPFVIYRLIKSVKRKHLDEIMIFFLCFLAMVLSIGVLAVLEKASAYYYFKFYYPVWMLGFIITAQAVVEIYDEARDLLLSGLFAAVILLGISVTNLEERVQNRGIGYGDRTSELFDIYYHNVTEYRNRKIVFDKDYLEACNYVMENMGKTENVPLISLIDNYEYCYWYEALTGEDSSDYYTWDFGMNDIMDKLNHKETKHFVICKTHPVYLLHQDYFDSFHWVFENDKVFIAETENRK
ncbi:hypothetical protein C805_00448 [Eubacterium sp. 14-2]|uniref:hypothetical protein n=1 Tax=Eubacterium sp. 14-2 TaxID=1235790 RepID=UPI00033E0B40|nr:hypothetical protein [Eubacterium sp. 14-2]EOT28306.1 hypothetical protein C805_00448 [Eubacterium sp. 14-2]